MAPFTDLNSMNGPQILEAYSASPLKRGHQSFMTPEPKSTKSRLRRAR